MPKPSHCHSQFAGSLRPAAKLGGGEAKVQRHKQFALAVPSLSNIGDIYLEQVSSVSAGADYINATVWEQGVNGLDPF